MSGAMAPEAETTIRQTEQLNRLMDQMGSRINRVQAELDRAWAAQNRFERAQISINSALDRGRISQERANQLLDLARQRYQQTGEAAQRFAVANDNAARGTRNFGGVIGQAGFQLQDFFVQVQGGTSALTALSQQGSQFLGVFGAGGAIAGAVLAIGALVAGLVLGKTEADRFKEAMERNRESFERATEAAERWRRGLRQEAEQLQDLRGYYQSLNRERQQYELRQANRDAAMVEERRRALERDVLGRLPGLSSGFNSQIVEAQRMAEAAYGRGSAEYDAITSNETLQRLREIVATIEGFRAAGDVSENAIAAFSARLREMAEVGGPVGRMLLRAAEEMEKLGGRSRDVERDTREVNARLAALGAQAGEAASRVGALADEMARLQRQAQQDIGSENAAALARAEARARALASGLPAARAFDAQQSQTDSADRYYREQRRLDEERLRSARFTDDQIREEISRTDEARRQSSNRRAELEAQNAARLKQLEEQERNARRNASAGERDAKREERLTDRARRERDQLISSLDEEAAANIRLEESLRRIEEARRRNLLSEEEATRLSQRVRDRREQEIVRANDKTELYMEDTKRLQQLTNELGSIMRDTWDAAVREGKSFHDVLKQVENQLLRLGDKYLLQPLLDQLAQLAMYQLGFGSGGGGLLGSLGGMLGGGMGGVTGEVVSAGAEGLLKTATAAVLHDGGWAGNSDVPTRSVPASVFLDATRYHTGGFAGAAPFFANDEVPAILKRGEPVGDKAVRAVAQSMGGRPINQTVIVKTEDPGAFNRTRTQWAGAMRRDLARSSRNA